MYFKDFRVLNSFHKSFYQNHKLETFPPFQKFYIYKPRLEVKY